MTSFYRVQSIYMETNILFTAWCVKILGEQHKVECSGPDGYFKRLTLVYPINLTNMKNGIVGNRQMVGLLVRY